MDKMRDGLGTAARYVRDKGISQLSFGVSSENVKKGFGTLDEVVQAIVEGIMLGTYRFTGYKKREEKIISIEDVFL